ncbi:hydrogenase formation protein HypD [Synechococcus sp. CS-1325]|nr:hydrogenase formation protein HypD [Synechococcus sp. CS-1325]PZU97037.1 MAG: hydrogenase formation protein HypD [Cyanobium sp.]
MLAPYRQASTVHRLAEALKREITRPWTVMEVCGGQTHAFLRHGLDQLLPAELSLIHGPGCPVCVTPAASIDLAMALAVRPELILCSYGDMLRVPGSGGRTLLDVRAAGADVRVVASPLDVPLIARSHPGHQVVFFAVGFETTAPATALLADQAWQSKLGNLSLLVCHVRVPPAMEALLTAPECRVQGFLAAGHVCTVMGTDEYEPIAARHRVPIVVTGFEPVDLLDGLLRCVRQLEQGVHRVENAYGRVGSQAGNASARMLIERVFQRVDRQWRGLGSFPASGLCLRPPYDALDAERRFPQTAPTPDRPDSPSSACISGAVLQGLARPTDCTAFRGRCRPEHPLGAPMVSAEGACAAYFRYQGDHHVQ